MTFIKKIVHIAQMNIFKKRLISRGVLKEYITFANERLSNSWIDYFLDKRKESTLGIIDHTLWWDDTESGWEFWNNENLEVNKLFRETERFVLDKCSKSLDLSSILAPSANGTLADVVYAVEITDRR